MRTLSIDGMHIYVYKMECYNSVPMVSAATAQVVLKMQTCDMITDQF